MEQIPTIFRPTEWFAKQRKGDVAIGRLLTKYADQSFSVMLSRFNSRYGKERDVFIHYHFQRATCIVVLVCVSQEEHESEYKEKKYEESWRRRIPSRFR